jgi:hypothetical protein
MYSHASPPILDIGESFLSKPLKFTGKIYSVTVDVSGDLIRDHEAEMRLVMARQ